MKKRKNAVNQTSAPRDNPIGKFRITQQQPQYINKGRLDCSSRFIQPSRRVLFLGYISVKKMGHPSAVNHISDFLFYFFIFFIVRPVAVLEIITTNISKYKRAAILYSESSIKTLCRCDNERNNHFPFDLVHLDAQQKTLKDEKSWKRRIRIRLVVVVLAVQNMSRSTFPFCTRFRSHPITYKQLFLIF